MTAPTTTTTTDCPICMEVVHSDINCVITACKHTFHTSCLLTNIVHNGFGCPYCRTEMVDPEILKEDDERDRLNEAFYDENGDDEDEESSSYDDEEDPHVWTTETRQAERGFLGMRMMFAREEEEEIVEDANANANANANAEEEEEDEEDSDASWMNSDEDPDDSSSEDDEEAAARASREPMNRLAIDSIIERENRSSRENYIPSPQEVTSFLEQSGYSLIDFVRLVLWNEHPEYDAIIAQRISRSTSRRVFHFIRGLLREYQGRIETNPNTNITQSDEEETNAEEVNEPQDSSWLTAQMEPFDDTGFFFMGSTASIDDEEDTPPEWSRTRFQLDLD